MKAPRVYAIADAAALGEPLESRLPEAVAAMVAAGVRWIQVRLKPKPPARPLDDRRLYTLLEACLETLDGSGTEMWIDDRVDLAAVFSAVALPVAGVHLGQRDLPPVAARRLVGDTVAIGMSTHDEAEVAAAVANPDVDLVAVGPVYGTASKVNPDPVVGLDLVRHARSRIDEAARETGARPKTLVAIGGIDAARLAAVLDAGADTVAVLSAACHEPVETSCRALVEAAEAWAGRDGGGVAADGVDPSAPVPDPVTTGGGSRG